MIKVNVNELRKVAVEYRADVNIWDIAKEAEQLYNAIKLVGIENVVTTYLKNDFSEEEKIGLESSKRIRAVAAYFMMNQLHMNDSPTSIGRLENHFGGISLDTTIGYRLGLKGQLTVSSVSNIEMLEKYIGGKQLEYHYSEVYVQRLYNLIVMKNENVELWALWKEIENLYKSIVTVGLSNTTIWYYNKKIHKVTMKGNEIPERMLAFCLFSIIHMYRIGKDDLSNGSYRVENPHIRILREKFGLNSQMETILGDTDIFEDRREAMKCISLRQIAGRYLKKSTAGKMTNGPILMQIPFDCIQRKMTDLTDETLYQLWTALDALYKTAKIVGISDVKVRYVYGDGIKTESEAIKLPQRVRAFCEEAVIYMYRMDDSTESRSRLEKHLGLEAPSKIILGDTNVVNCKGSMPCVCLKELVERLNSK